jgi:glycosyltransferase involved in cell wall biosynthesis
MKILTDNEVIFEEGRRSGRNPDVTVIMPLYNYQNYVLEALSSVEKQTIDQLSIVIVNDCSTDESEHVVIEWLKQNRNRFYQCLLVRNSYNYGLATTRNIALSRVTSKFVFALDADNILYPSAIEKLLTAAKRAKAQGAYCQLEYFGATEEVGYAFTWDKESFKNGNYVDAMALLETSALRAVRGYDLFEVSGWEDFDVWCKFVELGFEVLFVPQILCRYRIHGSSMLRMETNPRSQDVSLEIIARHPWLKLGE